MKTLHMTTRAMVFLLGAALVSTAFAQPPVKTNPSLYDRLGGLRGITLVVDDFINRLVKNVTLNKNPAIDAGRKRAPAPYLKFHVAQLICQVTGGPCRYTGRSMKESHVHLNISENEWKVMAQDFKKSLDKFKVPPAEQKELFAIVGGTKGDIVATK